VNKKKLKDNVITSPPKLYEDFDESYVASDNEFVHDRYSMEDCRIYAVQNVKRKIPTPWPINIIQERWNNRLESSSRITIENKNAGALNDSSSRSSTYPSMGAMFLAYAKQQARIGFRQVSEISSQIWYNLPPSAPPLILLAIIPRNAKLLEGRGIVDSTSMDSFRRIIPVFSDPFARSIVLAGLGMAVVSWSNQELQRKRRLTPLPLSAMRSDDGAKGGGRVSRVFLPPFLPEDVPEPEIDALLGTSVDKSDLGNACSDELDVNTLEESILFNVSPKIRKHLSSIYETTTTTSRRFFRNYYNDWLQGRAVRKREVAKIRRNRIFDELVALQALKKRQAISRNKSETKTRASVDEVAPELGYAIVTGASRGIGRAIAVELARWEIPLVLVARDVTKLAQLSSDLEACYGVKSCILEADLSQPNAAEKIYQATTEAGIPVDILINNAGIASEGLAINTKTSLVERMVMLNSLTYAKLSILYGRDMKEKRKGRILMISSMAGLCNASPNTAVYGACKAFGKSLALSMAKEMETFGVGVTCLMPGAVSNTAFRASSGTRKALCWYLPFYPRSPDIVAHQGVVSLLDGDTQSIPGWQNRFFANIIRPIIPQRLEVMIVQLAFSPLRIPNLKSLLRHDKTTIQRNNATQDSITNSFLSDGGSSWLSFDSRYKTNSPPRFLKLPQDEPKVVESDSKESNNNGDKNNELFSFSPITSNNVNSTEGKISEEVIEPNKKATRKYDPISNMNNSNEWTGKKEKISKIESKTIEQQCEPSITQHEELYSDQNAYNSDDSKEMEWEILDGVKRKSVVSERNASPPKIESYDYNNGEKPRIPSKHDNEKINEGNIIERKRRPQWFGYDDYDDDEFSTRLGPMTMKEKMR